MSTTPAGTDGSTPPAAGPPAAASPPADGGTSPARVTHPGWRVRAAWYAPVLAAMAVMTVFGLWGLARDSAMGNDEVVSRWAALLSLRQLAHLLRHVDAVHGLYYLLLHGWMVVGTSPTVMRIPSVVCMIVAAGLLTVLARRLTGSGWAALFAGLIMALTPSISYYAQTARSYALVFACVVGQTLVLVHALQAEADGRDRGVLLRRWTGYGALVLLGGYLNEMSLLVLVAHAVTVLLARYGGRAIRHWLIAAAVGGVLVVPLLALSVSQDQALNWVARPDLHDVWILFHDYFGATLVIPVLLAVCAVVALLPASRKTRADAGAGEGTRPEVSWWRSGGLTVPSVAAPLLILPAAILLVESLIFSPLYVDRYVLFGEAGAALLAAAGIWRAGQWLVRVASWRTLVWIPGAVVCVLALVLQLGAQHRTRLPASRLYNFGGPAFFIGAHSRPGDGVLFFSDFYRKAELGYPAEFRHTTDLALRVSPAVADPYQGLNKPVTQIRSLMLKRHRIWVLGRLPLSVVSVRTMRLESLTLLHGFTRTFERSYRGMWLTLWVRR